MADEIADTRETLTRIARRASELGTKKTVTVSLIGHTWAKPAPDMVAFVTDALVIFPWDRPVNANGDWQTHPELDEAQKLQEPGDS